MQYMYLCVEQLPLDTKLSIVPTLPCVVYLNSTDSSRIEYLRSTKLLYSIGAVPCQNYIFCQVQYGPELSGLVPSFTRTKILAPCMLSSRSTSNHSPTPHCFPDSWTTHSSSSMAHVMICSPSHLNVAWRDIHGVKCGQAVHVWKRCKFLNISSVLCTHCQQNRSSCPSHTHNHYSLFFSSVPKIKLFL